MDQLSLTSFFTFNLEYRFCSHLAFLNGILDGIDRKIRVLVYMGMFFLPCDVPYALYFCTSFLLELLVFGLDLPSGLAVELVCLRMFFHK